MPKHPMPDILVLLPGIMGSELRKDGRVVWGTTVGSLARTLFTRGRRIRKHLPLQADPVDQDDLGDGITAHRLLPDVHLLPGFWKIDGYSKVAKRLLRAFEVTEGENFFQFPYDWRRDNRVSARRLQRLAHRWLRNWRQQSGNDRARLILMAHSMGGLVSRYYLEVLEGWKDTRALITFGTPYRGSLNAVGALANGIRKAAGIVDFSEMGRTFTSLYQLLPIYKCYDAGDGRGEMVRIAEASGVPHIDTARAQQALAFHHEMIDAAKANLQDETYRREGHRLFPVLNYAQRTFQGARRRGDKVVLEHKDFTGKDRGGDGTVPRVSAVPPERNESDGTLYTDVKHASIQNDNDMLVQLIGVLTGFGQTDLDDFMSSSVVGAAGTQLSLEVDDLVWAGEPVTIRARPAGDDPERASLSAHLEGQDGEAARPLPLQLGADGWFTGTFEPLGAGDFEVVVSGTTTESDTAGSDGVGTVRDVFSVVERDLPEEDEDA